jgi:hypothetical protein
VPAFLNNGLKALPETIKHVVYRDPLRCGSSDNVAE